MIRSSAINKKLTHWFVICCSCGGFGACRNTFLRRSAWNFLFSENWFAEEIVLDQHVGIAIDGLHLVDERRIRALGTNALLVEYIDKSHATFDELQNRRVVRVLNLAHFKALILKDCREAAEK